MKLSTKELLEIAENDSTEPAALKEIWYSSRSPKVRKAVAANPNASPDVLKAAARLYMEEVVTNPGFEMLRLFDEDPWIKRIGEIYDNPASFFGRGRYLAYRTSELETLGRAALISPNCDTYSLSNLMVYMPVASIKRVIKNEALKSSIKEKISSAYLDGICLFDLEGLFKSWDAKLISTIELASYIKKSGSISTMSCRKSVYVKAFRELNREYLEGKTSDSMEAIISIMLMSRSSCFRWITYDLEDAHLPVIAEAFKISKKLYKRNKASKERFGTSYARAAAKELAGLITMLTWDKKPYIERFTGLQDFYETINKLELPPHEWGNSKHCWPTVSLDAELCRELDKLPMATKAFYARSMSLGGWFHMTKSEPKAKIAEEVNQWLYERGGVENLLYNKISLKKIIALDDSVVIP